MIQKNRRTTAGKYRVLKGAIAAVGIASVLWCQSFDSLADSTGTVTAASVNIREKTDTNSTVIGSVSAGAAVTIKDEVQDASGTLWYQVYVNGDKTGYIRADLIDKKDGGTQMQSDGAAAEGGNSQGDGGQSGSQSASGALSGPENAMDAQYAAVSQDAIKVRNAPSKKAGDVGRLERDAQVVVSGQSNGTDDGKVWYYITFTGSDGTEKTGYVRSDLVTLGDMVPAPEEPEPEESAPEEPEPAEPVNNEYELVLEQAEDGSMEWYLYDYTNGQDGYKQKLQQLLDANKVQGEDTSADAKALVKQRIIIVILGILAAILVVTVIIMAMKLRDVYYEEYEDEEDEEPEQEITARRRQRSGETPEADDAISRRRRREEAGSASGQRRRDAEREETPARRRRVEEDESAISQRRRTRETEDGPARRRTAEMESASGQRRRRAEEAQEMPVKRRRRPEEAEGQEQERPKRRTKNFLLDDDDFEFEFLNMDDRD